VDEDEVKLDKDEDHLRQVQHCICSTGTVHCINRLTQLQTFVHHRPHCKSCTTTTTSLRNTSKHTLTTVFNNCKQQYPTNIPIISVFKNLCFHRPSFAVIPHLCLPCMVGCQEGHPACKKLVVGCWCGYLSEARCRLAYGPADATATHCLLLQ